MGEKDITEKTSIFEIYFDKDLRNEEFFSPMNISLIDEILMRFFSIKTKKEIPINKITILELSDKKNLSEQSRKILIEEIKQALAEVF
uniref:FDX-ACB domain-containing protein n=1 Tax=candidate division CPR3 bacterium TaxID=2268181 RepID=A0A7C4R2Y8_UNCC3